jgi:hypothetical protein
MMTSDIERIAALRVTETGLSPAELLALPMDEYARVTGRATPAEAALQTLDMQIPGIPRQEPPAAPQAPENAPQGVDLNSLSMSEYATLRGWLGIGRTRQEGRGILNQSGQSWAEAARQQLGRSSWQGRNVIESPKLAGRQMRQGDMLDTRTAAQRLSNPANLWQGR